MATREKLQHVRGIAHLLLSRPREARSLVRWLKELRRPTMSSELPWLPFSLIVDLREFLHTGAHVFEFGAGGSTIWFAKNQCQVEAVEHDAEWYVRVEAATRKYGNCRVWHVNPTHNFENYSRSIAAYSDDRFDVVLVDGRERVRCCEEARSKVRPGGLLILDDSNRDRYAPVFEMLDDWESLTYYGFAPFKPAPAMSTVWRRPTLK